MIKETGEYMVDSSKLAYPRLLKNYTVMRDLMNKALNNNSNNLPIWCYYKLEGEIPPLDLYYEMYQHKGTSGLSKNVVLLELETLDNQAYLTNYYNWSDYLFYTNEEPNSEYSKLSLANLTNYSERDTIQATLFKITEDMIQSVIHQS